MGWEKGGTNCTFIQLKWDGKRESEKRQGL